MCRIAMISMHTCPLATLGGKETGGMNVYVRELSRELGRQGKQVDVFTRAQDPTISPVRHLAPRVRVIQIPAGPVTPADKNGLVD
jgi:D-inositol-3-phosphate glycosyltransferase